jgi:hypothetical protein
MRFEVVRVQAKPFTIFGYCTFHIALGFQCDAEAEARLIVMGIQAKPLAVFGHRADA